METIGNNDDTSKTLKTSTSFPQNQNQNQNQNQKDAPSTKSLPPLIEVNVLMMLSFSILLGFLASYVNCDLQRIMTQKPIAIHILGFMGTLFIYITQDMTLSASSIFFRSLFIYLMYVLITKSKWYFALLSISGILVYGIASRYFVMQNKRYDDDEPRLSPGNPPYDEKYRDLVLNIIKGLLVTNVIIGMLHYMYLQYSEYGKRFSFAKFLIGTGRCKKNAPKY